MPRKPNYRFERQQRDRAKAAKKAEKAKAKAEKAERLKEEEGETPAAALNETAPPADET